MHEERTRVGQGLVLKLVSPPFLLKIKVIYDQSYCSLMLFSEKKGNMFTVVASITLSFFRMSHLAVPNATPPPPLQV